jgi:hypothetical protein
VPYDFNETDFRISMALISTYLTKAQQVRCGGGGGDGTRVQAWPGRPGAGIAAGRQRRGWLWEHAGAPQGAVRRMLCIGHRLCTGHKADADTLRPPTRPPAGG